MELHIGLDDTDSPRGGCTTYIGAILLEKLSPYAKFTDYPNLVRLNPNIEWKTRGNGAVCLRMEAPDEEVPRIKETVVETVEENSDIGYSRTDPGIVFLEGHLSAEVEAFGYACLHRISTMSEAKKTLKHCGGEGIGYGSAIGIIGALGAIGTPLLGDHTYEFLAYRKPENRGSKRRVDSGSVFNMDESSEGTTFSNVDEEQKRILITPRGPDPVLLGIRGEASKAVRKAFLRVSLDEDLERWAIFRTNQGTDLHLPPIMDIAKTRPRCPISIEGVVSQAPRSITGKHVIFQIKDISGEIHVAAYEPSGNLRKTAKNLIVGDRIRVYGGIRPAKEGRPATVNLEKLEILEFSEETTSENPVCPTCGGRMESMGTNGGYRCRHCGLRDPHGEKNIIQKRRTIELGIYLPPPRSQRHLAKPLARYGRERPYLPEIPEYFWGLSYPREEI